MVVYNSTQEYIKSRVTSFGKEALIQRINALEDIIAGLIIAAATASGNEDIKEYWLNDGQTQIKTVYRGVTGIQQSIMAFEKMKQYYLNQVTGRCLRGLDSKNLTGNGFYNR